jgi:hypothetical protein
MENAQAEEEYRSESASEYTAVKFVTTEISDDTKPGSQ